MTTGRCDECEWQKYHFSTEGSSELYRPATSRQGYEEALYESGRLTDLQSQDHLDILVVGTAGAESTKHHVTMWPGILRSPQSSDTLTICDTCELPLAASQKMLSEHQPVHTIQTVQADGTQLPFTNGSFDIVVTHCLFECIDDDTLYRLVQECGRVTRGAGIDLHCVVRIRSRARELLERFSQGHREDRYGIRFRLRREVFYNTLFERAGLSVLSHGQDTFRETATFGVAPILK